MKIYCSSRYKSKEEFLDRLEGKDAWVKIETTDFNNHHSISWIKILYSEEKVMLPEFDNTPEKCYYCYRSYKANPRYKKEYLQTAYEEAMEDIETVYLWEITIAAPVEIVTTEELFKLGDVT